LQLADKYLAKSPLTPEREIEVSFPLRGNEEVEIYQGFLSIDI
jgi:hypothetical protein